MPGWHKRLHGQKTGTAHLPTTAMSVGYSKMHCCRFIHIAELVCLYHTSSQFHSATKQPEVGYKESALLIAIADLKPVVMLISIICCVKKEA